MFSFFRRTKATDVEKEKEKSKEPSSPSTTAKRKDDHGNRKNSKEKETLKTEVMGTGVKMKDERVSAPSTMPKKGELLSAATAIITAIPNIDVSNDKGTKQMTVTLGNVPHVHQVKGDEQTLTQAFKGTDVPPLSGDTSKPSHLSTTNESATQLTTSTTSANETGTIKDEMPIPTPRTKQVTDRERTPEKVTKQAPVKPVRATLVSAVLNTDHKNEGGKESGRMELPRRLSNTVQLGTESGRMEFPRRLSNTVQLGTESGRMEFPRRLSNTVQLGTQSDKIELPKTLSNTVQLTTQSDKIELPKTLSNTVQLTTQSDKIELPKTLSNTVQLTTQSDEMYLPKTLANTVQLVTQSDKIEMPKKLPNTVQELIIPPAVAKRLEELERIKATLEEEKRNLVNQEDKFREQLADLTAQLSSRDTESNKLLYQMEELQRDVGIKSSGMDRLQAELAAAHTESKFVMQRMRTLEEALTVFKQKNMDLAEELIKKAAEMQSLEGTNHTKVEELEANVKEITEKMKMVETQLEKIKGEKTQLEVERAEIEAEREEEMKIVQEALEEAHEQKLEIQLRFEQDFEKLRTVNTDREQQLLDDFEWKLREVEQACKRRLEEKDKVAEEKIKVARKEMETKLIVAEKQNNVASQLKTLDAEVTQLRGLTLEQQRSIRLGSRQTEQLQVSERLLKEDVARLKTSLESEKTHSATVQKVHDRHVAEFEKKLQTRLDQQKKELTAFWEERLRRECTRLKTELEQLHTEEKQMAIVSVKSQKEEEFQVAKKDWEQRIEKGLKEVSLLKERVEEKENHYHNELEKAQTNADRDILELRRKLDKLDMSYQEEIEKLTEKQEKEMEQLTEENEKRVLQVEQNWQFQMTSTRTTLELVKEQMERESRNKLENMEQKHRNQLEMQWEHLVKVKEDAVQAEVVKHLNQVDRVKQELEKALKARNSRESELLETIEQLKKQLEGQNTVISDLEGNVDLLQGSMQVLNHDMTNHKQEIQQIQQQTKNKIRERELQLEAEHQKKLVELKNCHSTDIKQWQDKFSTVQQQLQAKVKHLVTLLKDSQQRYENRGSLPQDVKRIAELEKLVVEQGRDQGTQFCQLEPVNHEANHNRVLETQPMVGISSPIEYHQKGRKGRKNRSPGRKKHLDPRHQPPATQSTLTQATTSPYPSPKNPRKDNPVGQQLVEPSSTHPTPQMTASPSCSSSQSDISTVRLVADPSHPDTPGLRSHTP